MKEVLQSELQFNSDTSADNKQVSPLAQNPMLNAGADFSECGRYRYKLWRIWDETLPRAMCIGLNPSTANATKTDPTITNLIKMLKILGYGGFYMMNCWPFISSKPENLKHNPVSDEWNNNLLTIVSSKCQDVIFCWGNFDIVSKKGRDIELAEMFPNAKCFGLTKSGKPFHPLAMMYAGKTNEPQLIKYEVT